MTAEHHVNQTAVKADGNNNYSVILIGDDGKPYLIPKTEWQIDKYKLPDTDPAQVPIAQAITFGTALADIPNLGVGVGGVCVFVNVKGIVEGF